MMMFLRTIAVLLVSGFAFLSHGAERVTLQPTPNGGIRPQVFVDAKGVVHMVYAWNPNPGERPGGDNLAYARKEPGQSEFSKPIDVNSVPRSVFPLVPSEMAVGRDGRVHVSWAASPRYFRERMTEGGERRMKYLFYTRLNDAGTAFEEQRNIAGDTFGFEMATAIVANSKGEVHLFWGGHQALPGGGDANRKVFGIHSKDEGRTFTGVEAVWDDGKGACACCTTEALETDAGTILLAYRSAEKNVNRDTCLLTSTDHGKTFTGQRVDGWEINACPMTSYGLVQTRLGTFFAWENKGLVQLARTAAGKIVAPVSPSGEGHDRKFPSVAANSKGEILLAWTEGSHYRKGGDLAWQVFDKNGNPTEEKGTAKGVIRAAAMPAAYSNPDGTFVILY
jgi:hypothetical protein